MSNEAAERLRATAAGRALLERNAVHPYYAQSQMRDAILAIEVESRTATVERIRAALEASRVPYVLNGLAAILDAEAER